MRLTRVAIPKITLVRQHPEGLKQYGAGSAREAACLVEKAGEGSEPSSASPPRLSSTPAMAEQRIQMVRGHR